jgi:pimeloyl-ACP methyl ester carboxylesterase
MDLASWIASGERVPVELASGRFEIFRRLDGAGRTLTMLHGFPTSSWDWAPVHAHLHPDFRILAFDFLGFGDSDKPRKHRYSLLEQADIVEAMWDAAGIRETILVAHDYGVSVTKELLARELEGRLRVRLRGVVLSNGILYEAAHRPLRIQKLLANRVLGPIATRLVRERDFTRDFSSVFSVAHPLDAAEAAQHWRAISQRDGTRIYDRLAQYLREGHIQSNRWRAALHGTTVPVRYVWGLEDPVTGLPMLDELRRLVPTANIVELDGIGHYPQLEVPGRYAAAIVELAAEVAPASALA